ncbi:HlyD family secretion protein [Pseudomonas sp. FP1154]|jgi:membrane fusion protein (multidrug efflux system)|uniref:Efflux transporter periplasmic adaptor subunit n=1 Tax=Pseudomonas rhizophila TaxID=2045200 RepID=A0ABN5JQZ8_9PSED|nr:MULTISPECIES: HlyD family secretion protein [Pseudomonas]AVU74610.1 efflux transporter periplasmic adaptor subunit [Pseudomonas rhizophila]MBD0704162.1 efflux transporter periplasmic adaptor subunit [Pseudomonas sp. PSB1]MEA1030389.1 HlyD family secretion protein [Pseudomonas sp. N-137]QKJ36406.1 HlyD family secretion protein [Pseudomonas sp. MPDS]WLG25313.1 HlyD family secretion protein [Pseudomonas sp. FP1154]
MALPKKAQIISAVLLVGAIGGVLYFNRPESSASIQSTDDAYVHADFTTVAPQVSGTVETVLVEDNQPVNKGDLLATLDDRDFVAAVNAAKAQLASARAGVASLQAHLIQQDTVIRQAQAAVAADEAALKLAKVNHARYRNLATDGSGTVQAQQQAEAQLSVQLASRDKSQAGLQAARQQVDVLKADLEKAKATLAHAQAALDLARLKLSYTRITAPISGTIGQKSVRIGAFVNAGKPLLAIVPLEAVYISANFRETQLARVKTGQTVEIEVDALPGEALQGTVQSLGPASGVSYSTVAPHNATGNFTKIVQRLPVRIRIDPDQSAAAKLRVGMSVTPSIRIGE